MPSRPVQAKLTLCASPPPAQDFASVVVVGQRGHLAAAAASLGDGVYLPKGRCGAGLAVVAGNDDGGGGDNNNNSAGGDRPTRHVNGRDAVVATSSTASRHNSAVRPDAIGDAVASAVWADGGACPATVLVVAVAADAGASVVAIAAAVAHKFPTFSMRTGGKGGAEDEARVKCEVTLVGTWAGRLAPARAAEIATAQAVADEVRRAASLVDAPPNVMHTDRMVEEARTVAAEVGASIQVIRGEELRERGMGLIYGVGRAAEHPPALAVLTFEPESPSEPAAAASPAAASPAAGASPRRVVALVGKGITYDTGGLSIKSKEGMPGMKCDMGGSAGVLGAFAALVRSGTARAAGLTALHAVLCLAENAVDERATRPDDVHTAYSGLTVEVNNTDAEGRLVLGDGCAFAARDLGATHIIDMATLTGAQGIATGQRHAAVLAATAAMERVALAAGRRSGNLCFPVLYAPEYLRAEFSSAVADMKNSVRNRSNAQVSCAGQFIANHVAPFIAGGGRWLHIDMAAPAKEKASERATGFGVALLLEVVRGIGRGEGDADDDE
jgi:probable aminopeptidase NPEPL1